MMTEISWLELPPEVLTAFKGCLKSRAFPTTLRVFVEVLPLSSWPLLAAYTLTDSDGKVLTQVKF